MTAPLTRVSNSWVALLPIEPEDQDGAAFAERYPEGTAVRLGLTDGLVMIHCRERPEGDGEEAPGELAVIVATPSDCPDAGQVRVWRGSQIVDSPLSGDGIADLRRAIPRQRGALVVEAIRRRWGALYRGDGMMPKEISGITTVSVPHGASLAIGSDGDPGPADTAETEDAADPEEEGEDEDYPDAGEIHAQEASASSAFDRQPGWPKDEDLTVGDDIPMIPAEILGYVSDESLCEIRRAAADGTFGANGYDVIDREFRSRAVLAQFDAGQPGATESDRLRHAMYHYCGLYADLNDEGDIDHPGGR